MPTGKRLAYLSPPEDEDEDVIRAEVGGENGDVAGDVLDVSLKGAAVRIALEHDPTFAIGERVNLTLDSDTLGSATIQATVRARSELSGFRRFDFAFPNPDTLRRQLNAKFMRFFNERKAFRIEPSPETPIDVHMTSETYQPTGRLRDLSADGVGIIVDGESERRLARVVDVGITFALPGHARPVSFQASIRKRFRLDGTDGVCYGLSWDPEVSDFSTHQQRVIDYVMVRQRELLQTRAAT